MPAPSLYEQAGGDATLRPAVELFYRKVFQDAALLPFFDGIDRERLKAHQLAFISQALGGPGQYEGRELRDAHAAHPIEQRHFDSLTLHMEIAFLEMGLSEEVVAQALRAIKAATGDIVNTR
ncbi:MAG: group 1 truncated hemoglobin [Bryobacterales bacterium]|nr:group 1 truncated hemoglobin [Bryobacterales bacterium]